jgi:hypothetical protein
MPEFMQNEKFAVLPASQLIDIGKIPEMNDGEIRYWLMRYGNIRSQGASGSDAVLKRMEVLMNALSEEEEYRSSRKVREGEDSDVTAIDPASLGTVSSIRLRVLAERCIQQAQPPDASYGQITKIYKQIMAEIEKREHPEDGQ